MSRPCWCQCCNGTVRRYSTAKKHEARERERQSAVSPHTSVSESPHMIVSESLEPVNLQRPIVSSSSVNYSDEKQHTTSYYEAMHNVDNLEDIIETFTMDLMEQQSWGFETQATFNRTLSTIKKRSYENVINPEFADGLPKDYRQAKQWYLKDLMQRFYKIPCCVNLCVLFRKEHEFLDKCPVCGAERYVVQSNDSKKRKERQWSYYFGIKDWIQKAYSNEVFVVIIINI